MGLQKIDAHALSAEEVEAAFDQVFSLEERKDGSYDMFAQIPAGRRIWMSGAMIERIMRFRTSSASQANRRSL
jgi:hypothetical protein